MNRTNGKYALLVYVYSYTMLLHSFLQNEFIISVIHVDLILFRLVKYMFMILYYVTVAAQGKSLISCLCSPMSL